MFFFAVPSAAPHQGGCWVHSSVCRTTLQEAERPAASCGPAGPQAALPVLSRTQILSLPSAERERKWPVGKISGAGLSSADLMSLTGHQ